MLGRLRVFFPVLTLGSVSCSFHPGAHAEALTVRHPDDASKTVEYFLEKPAGTGPSPTVVFVHGHQQWPRPGAKDFVNWGVLNRFAKRGYIAVAISQPGYGASTGPADFCGTLTQHAISGVIQQLERERLVSPGKIVIEGISRGAIVASLLAAHDPSFAGIVLISGLYDLNDFVEKAKSGEAARIAQSILEETGGGSGELRARSALNFAREIKAQALIMNGALDDRTDPAQAQRLAREISSHGGQARAIIYTAYGHQIPVSVRDKEIDPFLDRILGKSPR
jgi:dipeptidyl aminopeptidase/acylaminoacyl peptidase